MMNKKPIEYHPLSPFIPEHSTLLMLGSFPPPREKWSMDFYYPNLQNDMWRIFGVVFFGHKDHFLISEGDFLSGEDLPSSRKRGFSKFRLQKFLTDKGIALYDAATAVIREKGNASDRLLRVEKKTDIPSLLTGMPECRAVVTTGELASSIVSEITGLAPVKVGGCEIINIRDRIIRHHRMPSSSRAYPLALENKAEFYKQMFREEGLL